LAEVYKLRVSAWRSRNGAFPADIESWSDAYDVTARHFIIVADDRPVAAARVTIHASLADAPDGEVYAAVTPADAPAPIGAISRLVVCPQYAGRGLSRRLDDARIKFARQAGCKSVIGHTTAGPSRIAQLQALGFRCLHVADKQPPGALAGTGLPQIIALDLGA
jgi:GNAT superfamily N-acetyltransferase